jgi:hypothetical protein
MVRIAIFHLFLLAALIYALRKGGGPERAMALILIAMSISDLSLHQFAPPRFTSLDAGHLAIDVTAASATLLLALTAHRFWPMIAATLQFLPLLAHLSRAVNVTIQPVAYLTMQVGPSWLLPPLLALATWRHQERVRTIGSDRSWYISWRRSTHQTANR